MYKNDVKYMSVALDEALKASPEVYPNPKVGAVIVHDDKIISCGHTQDFGGKHAEVMAIENMPSTLKGCTLYVTLEPCTHKGKTDACIDLITPDIFKRVVIANLDPNPIAKGGVKKLIKDGIIVETGICSKNAKKINRRFFTFFEKKRPYIILKIASTLNGVIAEKDGNSEWITCQESRTSGHKARSCCDAIMVGRKTIEFDNPSLTSHGLGKNPRIIIIDPKNKLDHKANVFKSDPIVFSDILNSKKPIENVSIILKKLYDLSIQSLYVEGGGQTISYFIDANLYDELQIYYSPKMIGEGKPLYNGMKKLKDNLNLTLNKIEQFDNDIKVTYLKGY